MKLKRGVMAASEFAGLQWINSDPLSLGELKGKVVLVHFWDYCCIHCLRAMSYIKVWYERYHDKGLVVIGIHAPEFPFGKDHANIERAVEEMDLRFPVAMDNDFLTWHRYSNRFWPASFLVDKEGFLSDYHFGEGGYQELEMAIQTLLREINPRVLLPRIIEPLEPEDETRCNLSPVTPDIYLGFRRGRIGNPEGFLPRRVIEYAKPKEIVPDVFYCEGRFIAESDYIIAVGDAFKAVSVSYVGRKVYLVAGPEKGGKTIQIQIEQDGKPLSEDTIGEGVNLVGGISMIDTSFPKLYNIVRNKTCGRHHLVLKPSDGACLYCLSFLGDGG